MKMRFSARLSTVAAVTFVVALAVPASGEVAPPSTTTPPVAAPSEGLTRESLSEPTAPAPHVAATRSSTASTARKHRRRHAEIDPKDFVAIHHTHRHREVADHHRAAPKKSAQVAVNKSSARRNPVESFVYWWNGLVVRNFHTRTGTVLLDRIGAKS